MRCNDIIVVACLITSLFWIALFATWFVWLRHLFICQNTARCIVSLCESCIPKSTVLMSKINQDTNSTSNRVDTHKQNNSLKNGVDEIIIYDSPKDDTKTEKVENNTVSMTINEQDQPEIVTAASPNNSDNINNKNSIDYSIHGTEQTNVLSTHAKSNKSIIETEEKRALQPFFDDSELTVTDDLPPTPLEVDKDMMSVNKHIYVNQYSNGYAGDLIQEAPKQELHNTSRANLNLSLRNNNPKVYGYKHNYGYNNDYSYNYGRNTIRGSTKKVAQGSLLHEIAASDVATIASSKKTAKTGATHSALSTTKTNKTNKTNTTCVSSVADAHEMNDILVVILGIGKYDGLSDLNGVEKDYSNIIHTYIKYWKYKVLYKIDGDSTNEENSLIYTNDRKITHKNKNYKLNWTIDDIELFIEQARKTLVKNKHDGLIFAISSHGDCDKVIYDSKQEIFELDSIFSMFCPQWSLLLETYTETTQESNHLFKIPKIFCIDSCRGSLSAKLTMVSLQDKIGLNKNNAQKDKEDKTQKSSPNADEEKNNTVNEQYKLKTISKEQAKQHFASMSNFCKLWANVEGHSVADGSINGGLFLRSVCKLFKDRKYIYNHTWTDIVLKIREYTKREASLIGIFNFTQLVESQDTLEYPIKFKTNSYHNGNDDGNNGNMRHDRNNNRNDKSNMNNNGMNNNGNNMQHGYQPPRDDEIDYHVKFTESVLGLELYSDEDGYNCIVGRCVSNIARANVTPGSQIVQVNDRWLANFRFEEIRDAVKQAAKSPPLNVNFRVKCQVSIHQTDSQNQEEKRVFVGSFFLPLLVNDHVQKQNK